MPRVSRALTVRTNRRRNRDGTFTQIRPRSKISRGMVSTREHHFIRTCSTQAISPLAVNSLTGFGTSRFDLQFNFTLQGANIYLGGVLFANCAMPNYSELVNLYDQYRIDSVDCEFMFSNNYSSVGSPGTTLPVFIAAKDFDDNNATTYTDLQQYGTAVTWQVGEQQGRSGKKTIRVNPNVDIAVYRSAITSGYARAKPMFIDTASSDTPHYGFKLAFDPIFTPVASTVVGYLSINFKYHLTMTNTK